MNLHLQPNDWSCVPSAFGIVLDIFPEEMIGMIGHDGSKIVSDEPPPKNRQAFHPQECIPICIKQLVYPVHFDVQPQVWVGDKPFDIPFNKLYLEGLLHQKDAVLIGYKDERSHAVAWCHKEQKCFDPIGYKYPLEEFELLSMYIMF